MTRFAGQDTNDHAVQDQIAKVVSSQDWMLLEVPGGSWIGFPARPTQAIEHPVVRWGHCLGVELSGHCMDRLRGTVWVLDCLGIVWATWDAEGGIV